MINTKGLIGGTTAILLISTLLTSVESLSNEHHLCKGFVEKNDLLIPVPKSGQQKLAVGVTKTEFEAAIGLVEQVYAPIFSQKGKRLKVKKLWENAQVNAVAYTEGGYAVVEIWGGLGRHYRATPDALTLIACHEVGHHLGGTPKMTDQASGAWASVEGQSDYFATLKCLRKVFSNGIDSWSGQVDPLAQAKCEESYGVNSRESKVCMRIASASLASANLSAALSGGTLPSLSSHDSSVVNKTYEKHPAAQCRLDTYMNGNVCKVSDLTDVSDRDPEVGVCRNISSEEYGARSLCWYKPIVSSPAPTPVPPAPAPAPTPIPVPLPPPVQPSPTEGIAGTPLLNGGTEHDSRNPNQVIVFSWDVSASSGAVGIYFEVLGPNKEFIEPNGLMPDRFAIRGGNIRALRGQLRILPAQQLPGWGVYKFRVIPLDATGRKAVGRFSNPAVLKLAP